MHAEGGAATLIRDECRQTNGTLLRRYRSDVRCVMGEDAERVTCLSVCMCIVLWPVRVLIECAPPWASPRRPEPNKDPDVRRVYHLPQIHRPWIHMIVIVCRPVRDREASITSNENDFSTRAAILIRTSRFTALRTTQ